MLLRELFYLGNIFGKYYYHQETGLERQNDLPKILENEDNAQAIPSSFHSV